MMEEKERLTPRPIRENMEPEQREDVVQNYRAIMNKLNEKPPKRRWQPALYAAGAAVLVIVAATAVTQIGNYQNLKTLQQTMQALSGAVSEESASAEDEASDADELSAESDVPADADVSAENGDSPASGDAESTAADASGDTDTGDAADMTSAAEGDTANAGSDSVVSASESAGVSDYYIVQKGDNLFSISQYVYGTDAKVEEICALNGIEDMDMIYEGQKLLLP
ncbi:MAG: LysM peptidoglycan-binding domain-containing protein [Lachnospiraceae bacterium]|nr:LysM peptidoglycan-binding domain-containing protein [Lachnospiraceae bacterium]